MGPYSFFALLLRSAAQTEIAGHSDELLRGDSRTSSLVNASKWPTAGATLEISLGSETVATMDRGALNVLSTRIARQGRRRALLSVQTTPVVLFRKSAVFTPSVLEPGNAPTTGGAFSTKIGAILTHITTIVLVTRDVPTTSVLISVVMTGTAVYPRNVWMTSAG